MAKFISAPKEDEANVEISVMNYSEGKVALVARIGNEVSYILNMNENGIEFINMRGTNIFNHLDFRGYPIIYPLGTLPKYGQE